MAKRGQLTEKIIQKVANLHEIKVNEVTKDHLRILPYIAYILVNERTFDKRRMTNGEVLMIEAFTERGLMFLDDKNKFKCTKEFWLEINDIIYDTYVDIE